jgi:PKD repeat protein
MKQIHLSTFLLAFVLVFAIGVQHAEAQLQVTPANEIDGWTADSLVRNVLMSGGVSISNVRFNGFDDDLDCDNIGVFQTGATPTNLGIERGLIIATGNVRIAEGPNDNPEANETSSCSTYSDNSLEQLATSLVYDVAVLEFDFVPWDSVISFNYVFASEEYPEYVGEEFNDVFGFFVTGLNPDGGSYNNTNMALVPGTGEVVSIHTVNNQYNAQYYVNNNSSAAVIQYDGFTVPLCVSFKVVPLTQYHIKLGICNVGDYYVDSGVFLEANSFQSPMSYVILIDGMYHPEIPEGYTFCTNRAIDFDTETTWIFDNVKWYFGDGTSAQGRHVQHTYAADGFYEVTNVLYNPHRSMDSLYITKVIEVRSQYGSEDAFVCHGEPFSWHGMQLTESGVYTDTVESYMGCDSIVTLHLTIGDVVISDTMAKVCESFTWYGQTYQTSGRYEHTLQTAMGCDSIVRLNLIVNPVVVTDTMVASCSPFTWYGQTIDAPGEYERVFRTTLGCDSIVRLHLTLGPSVETDTVATSCKPFTWYGQTYTASGQYEHIVQTGIGCDSIVRLHLTINPASETDTIAVSCKPFTWYGQTLTTSGQYERVLQTDMGCDSIVRLNLTIEEVLETDTTAVSCGAFAWHGQTFESSGNYEQWFQTSLGCDSLVKLHLTVNHSQQQALQGPQQVSVASNLISASYEYYVPDSLGISPNTLNWSCTNPDWIVTPSENRYRCHLWVTNLGQGTLIARTEHDCDTVYSVEINATWFDLDENESIPVEIFPNPANTEVTVQAEEIDRIRIMDFLGLVSVEKGLGKTGVAKINIGHLPQGVYVMEITTNKGKTARKLVVSR